MPTQAEKERRILAATKRRGDAIERYEKYKAKAEQAAAVAEKEQDNLKWLHPMPVDDDGENAVAQAEAGWGRDDDERNDE